MSSHPLAHIGTTLSIWGCVHAKNYDPKRSGFDKISEALREWDFLEAGVLHTHMAAFKEAIKTFSRQENESF